MIEAHGNISAASIVNQFLEIVEKALTGSARLVQRVGDEVVITSDQVEDLVHSAEKLLLLVEKKPNFPLLHGGMHVGKILEQKGHFFGSTINLTSRLAAYAHGGQILCSIKIVEKASSLSGINFKSLGMVNFKNISQPLEIFEILFHSKKQESKTIDPVCRMQVDPNTAQARINHQDKTYFFCSLDCARQFAENPLTFSQEY